MKIKQLQQINESFHMIEAPRVKLRLQSNKYRDFFKTEIKLSFLLESSVQEKK